MFLAEKMGYYIERGVVVAKPIGSLLCTVYIIKIVFYIWVKAQQNVTFGLSYEKNEAVLTACSYFVIIINIIISKMPHESLETVD